MVGGYMEDFTNHRAVKIGGLALARRWVFAQDNAIAGHELSSSWYQAIDLVLDWLPVQKKLLQSIAIEGAFYVSSCHSSIFDTE